MPKIIQGYPFSILVDAFRSTVISVLAIFVALWLATALTSFVAWQLPDPIYFVVSAVYNPIFWACLLTTGWVWIPMLVLVGSLTAYFYLPAIRFDLILLVVLVGLYLNVFLFKPEDLPGRFSMGGFEPGITTITPVHYDHLPGVFVARLAIATVVVVAFWIITLRAFPWRERGSA